MKSLIEAQQQALLNYKTPCEKTLTALRAARSAAQRAARRCANEIQLSTHFGNIRCMYDGIQKALGPSEKEKLPPQNKVQWTHYRPQGTKGQMVKHYSELYLRETLVTDAAFNSITQFPLMDKLDAKPNIEELRKAIDALSNGKAPGIPRPAP